MHVPDLAFFPFGISTFLVGFLGFGSGIRLDSVSLDERMDGWMGFYRNSVSIAFQSSTREE